MRRLLQVSLASLLACGSFCLPTLASPEPPLQDRIAEVSALLESDRLEEAATSLLAVLRLVDDSRGAPSIAVSDVLALVATVQEGSYQELSPGLSELAHRVALKPDLAPVDDAEQGLRAYFLAMIAFKDGRVSEALSWSRESVRLLARLDRSPEHANALNGLAIALATLGSEAAAIETANRALFMAREAFADDDPALYPFFLNLAIFHLTAGNPRPALELASEAVALAVRHHGPDSLIAAIATSHVAVAEIELGQAASARDRLERAILVYEIELGEHHHGVGTASCDLARAYLSLGELAPARAAAERALAIHEAAFGGRHVRLIRTLNVYASILAGSGETELGFAIAHRSEQIRRQHVRLAIRYLGEERAIDYSLRDSTSLDTLLSLSLVGADASRERAAYDAVIRSRAMVLDEMIARQRLVGDPTDPEVARLAQRLAEARHGLASLRVREASLPDDLRDRLRQAESEAEQRAEELARHSAAFRAEEESRSAGLEAVAASLPPDAALISFVAYRDHRLGKWQGDAGPSSYLAFVLRSGQPQPALVRLGSADAVGDRIRRWRDEISRYSIARYRRRGDELRRAVWDPLLAATQGAERIFVVPDGELHLVNLATLPARDGGYLVERDPVIHYLSAERDLLGAEPATSRRGSHGERPPPRKGLLAVGGVDFDAGREPVEPAEPPRVETDLDSPCTARVEARFVPLPASTHEARDVGAIFESSRRAIDADVLLLTGDAATEAAFKALAPGHRLLHLATHGFSLPSSCSPRPRGSGDRNGAAQSVPTATSKPRAPPLSGLAMAGANSRLRTDAGHDDGILTAQEIGSLNLSGVEWAVLSACESGSGNLLDGEGVLGLRRAFRIAGAQSLVMSLWKVEDEAAWRWMKALYSARLANPLGGADAVRRASLEILAERRRQGLSDHPYYWGAFVAEGAPR